MQFTDFRRIRSQSAVVLMRNMTGQMLKRLEETRCYFYENSNLLKVLFAWFEEYFEDTISSF